MILLLFLVSIFLSCGNVNEPKPYEATWLELEKTDNGYVVYNYPSRWGDRNTQSPEKIIVKGSKLTRITFSDDVFGFHIDSVKIEPDSSFLLYAGHNYRFRWIDKEKHIAQWTTHYYDGRVGNIYLYVDSLYNTFPIIDFDWGEERPATGEAD